jgi:transposase
MLVIDIRSLLDKGKCYEYLLSYLHPQGLCCPCCHWALPAGQSPHKLSIEEIPSYKCRNCGSVFNLFSNTIFKGIRLNIVVIVLMIRGFLEGKTTQHLSKELQVKYENLLRWRHKLQQQAFDNRNTDKLTDMLVESDEVFINAGEKGIEHPFAEDPPRVRGNKRRGIGTFANDRPPVQGLVGRESDQIRLEVCDNIRKSTIQPNIDEGTETEIVLYTDESHAYNDVKASGRAHKTVLHSAKEFARDEDGDGFCEVHCNTAEGIWVGLRNFLRPFRGVSKHYLYLYVAMFELYYNYKERVDDAMRLFLACVKAD